LGLCCWVGEKELTLQSFTSNPTKTSNKEDKDMDLTIEEFQKMTDDRTQQAIKIAMLEKQVEEYKKEIANLMGKIANIEMARAAERLTNMLLTNYIILSVEKIKTFLSHLKGVEHFAFVKTFIEFALPTEHYQEQLQRVNEVMILPNEQTHEIYETHNHFEAGSGCQVFNDKVTGQFDK
jgi:acetyl-CoA carboxylase alpha subunit